LHLIISRSAVFWQGGDQDAEHRRKQRIRLGTKSEKKWMTRRMQDMEDDMEDCRESSGLRIKDLAEKRAGVLYDVTAAFLIVMDGVLLISLQGRK
jgi:hypothetical protein